MQAATASATGMHHFCGTADVLIDFLARLGGTYGTGAGAGL